VFIYPLKTAIIEALTATFDANYPEANFRQVAVSLEYPMAKEAYPGIWVDFTPTQPVQSAGINHVEYIRDEDGGIRRTTKFRYAGTIQMTCVALTSLERDRLIDEVLKVLAFGLLNPDRAVFRQTLIANDLVACDPQWDKFAIGGKDESQGTPWGTNEVVYEQTASMDCTGDFYPDPDALVLVPLSKIEVFPYVEGTTPPVLPPQ
jgi:hypothetical protein